MAENQHPDPLLLNLEAPLRAICYPLGFSAEVTTNDERVLETCEQSFAVFRAGFPGHPPLRLRLVRDPAGRNEPPWPAVSYRYWGNLFSIVCGRDNFLVVDMERREAMGYFSPAMLDDREFFRWTFLDCAVYMLLQKHHVSTIHAACVVRDASAVCFCGPPGAGKSSLAYRCLCAGFSLLADDAVYLLRSPAEMQLLGNPSRLHFPVSARRLFPELERIPVGIRRDGDEFLAVSPASLGARVTTEAAPGAIVFLDRRPDAFPAIQEVSDDEALRLLFDPLPLLGDAAEMEMHRQAIERLVAGRAYRLSYRSVAQAVEQLDRLPWPLRSRNS